MVALKFLVCILFSVEVRYGVTFMHITFVDNVPNVELLITFYP